MIGLFVGLFAAVFGTLFGVLGAFLGIGLALLIHLGPILLVGLVIWFVVRDNHRPKASSEYRSQQIAPHDGRAH